MYWARFFMGVMLALALPISSLIISEISPKDIRGRALLINSVFYMLGKFYLLFLALIYLDNLHSGNWRALILVNAIPAFILFWFALIFLKESARFLIAHGKFERGFEVINFMLKKNNPEEKDLVITVNE